MASLIYDGNKLIMHVDEVRDTQGDGDDKPINFQRFELEVSWTGYRGSRYFHGHITEIRVWSRASSTNELQMNLCGVDSQLEGLVAYWKINEGEGYISRGATGHGYDTDWTNAAREVNEGTGLTYSLSYSNAITWDGDGDGRCNE